MNHAIALIAATPAAAGAPLPAGIDTGSATQVIDARPLPCPERRARVFAAAGMLAPGESFLLVNDHDPRPLHGHLCRGYGVAWVWSYELPGPEVYVVRVGRPAEG